MEEAEGNCAMNCVRKLMRLHLNRQNKKDIDYLNENVY